MFWTDLHAACECKHNQHVVYHSFKHPCAWGVQVGGDDGDNSSFEEPLCGGLTSSFLMFVVRVLMDKLVHGTFVTYSAWCVVNV